jgi:hypothetical protein
MPPRNSSVPSETMAARHQDLRTTRPGSGVNGALDGRRVQRDAVAGRAEIKNVENLRGVGGCERCQ